MGCDKERSYRTARPEIGKGKGDGAILISGRILGLAGRSRGIKQKKKGLMTF